MFNTAEGFFQNDVSIQTGRLHRDYRNWRILTAPMPLIHKRLSHGKFDEVWTQCWLGGGHMRRRFYLVMQGGFFGGKAQLQADRKCDEMWLQIKPVTVEFTRGWARRCWRLLLLVEVALTSSCYRCGWMLAVNAREIMRYWIRIDTLEIIQLWSNLRELWSPGGTDHYDRAKTRDWETAWHPTRVAGKFRVLSVVQGSIKTFFLRSVALADFDDVEQNKFINNVATLSGIQEYHAESPHPSFRRHWRHHMICLNPTKVADSLLPHQDCVSAVQGNVGGKGRILWGNTFSGAFPNSSKFPALISSCRFRKFLKWSEVITLEYAGKLGDARHKWQRKVVDSFRTWFFLSPCGSCEHRYQYNVSRHIAESLSFIRTSWWM